MNDELKIIIEVFSRKLDKLEVEINNLKEIMTENRGAEKTNSKWLNAFYTLLASGMLINVFDALMDIKKYHW